MPTLKIMLAAVLLAGCTMPPAPGGETYFARGQEPGWTVTIANGRMSYVGDYGETRLTVPRPEARPSFNGLRYETRRLTVDISYVRCNDAMSGHGYAHQVLVIADRKAVRGCGGERRPDWDN